MARIRPSGRMDRKPAENLSFRENVEAFRSLPRFFRLIWETSPSLTIGNVLLRLIQAGVPLAVLYVGKLIIDEVVRLSALDEPEMDRLWLLVGIELGLVLLSAALSRAISLLDALLGDLFANKSSVELIAHAARLDLPQFEDPSFYDKMERARQQTTSRVALMSQLLSQGQDIITIIVLGAGLVAFNPWLILLLVVAVVPVFLSETHFNRESYSLARSWTPERRELDYLRYIGASDEMAKEVKIFGLENFLKERFATVAERYYQVNKKLAIRRAGWGYVFNALGDIAYYGAYVFIVIQTVRGQISLGDLTFLAGSFNRLRNLMQAILVRFSDIAQRALYLQDLFSFFEIKPSITSPAQPLPFPNPIREGFTFEHVSFKYPGTETYAVKDVSFTLQAGEKLALVGENGAGKTTLVKLLSRLYDPSEGRILLDGKDLRSYSLEDLRQSVGVIFQDFVRFDLKASENIAIGRINRREEQELIEASARQSLADAVIEPLPRQYEQMLGRRFEGGVDLSGGQWQKIALARAYMRDAQLLILDEPTAALDARAEYEVFERFSELTKGKTAVLISHRFSTVRMADRILVLKNGVMVEIGTHEELLAKGGLYAELFNLQAAGYR